MGGILFHGLRGCHGLVVLLTDKACTTLRLMPTWSRNAGRVANHFEGSDFKRPELCKFACMV